MKIEDYRADQSSISLYLALRDALNMVDDLMAHISKIEGAVDSLEKETEKLADSVSQWEHHCTCRW